MAAAMADPATAKFGKIIFVTGTHAEHRGLTV